MFDRTLTVGAYTAEGCMFCPICYDKREVEATWESYSEAALMEEFGEGGLDCAGCGDEIVPAADNDDIVVDGG